MLNDPNISSPANIDAAIEYRDNNDLYKKKVKKLTS
jgi:ubiquitin-conjugating enzyme E2 R